MDENSPSQKSNEVNQSKRFGDLTSYYPLFFTIIFLIILFQYSFASLEAIFYDLRIRYDFNIEQKDNMVLVSLDEESDEFLGESYPYSYAGHKRFFERVAEAQPAAIIYLVDFLEPESRLELNHLQKFKKSIQDYKNQGGIFRFGTSMNAWGEELPPEDLQDLGYSLSLINIDNAVFAKDNVSRRAILNASGESSLHLWMANRFRKKQGMEPLSSNEIHGSYYLREADASFSLFRYATSPALESLNMRQIPFHRAQVGNFPENYFKDRIVLVGPRYISNASDFVLTPFNREDYKASKLAVHANIIQSLFQHKTVKKVPKEVSFVISVLLAIVLSLVISRVKPTKGLVFTVVLIFGIFAVSQLLFSFFGLWLYLSHIILTIFVVYYIWVPFRAIGEYQRRYAIQEEAKLLKKVENLKQNFISLMSHDLKTPVAKISGLVDVMKQKYRTEPAIQKDLDMMTDATRELNKFITSILDLTKIESSDLSIQMVTKDINKVVGNVVDNLKYEASKKNVRVDQSLAPLYPIHMDPNLMNRVISNLVENAIKYSGENTSIEISTWDDDEWVYLKVEDNGVGIGEEDLEHIFDRFYRVKNDASHKIKGTGLGLYLVKYFVELHGGTITADSALGQGTSFTVKLKNQ